MPKSPPPIETISQEKKPARLCSPLGTRCTPAAAGYQAGRAGADPAHGRAADRYHPRHRPQPLPGAVEPAGRLPARLAGRAAGRGGAVRILVARHVLPAHRGLPALSPRHAGWRPLLGESPAAGSANTRGGGAGAGAHPPGGWAARRRFQDDSPPRRRLVELEGRKDRPGVPGPGGRS